MSRSNPYKKKKRFAKKTTLLFGEGLGEEMFLRHLKGLYARDTGVQIKICRGKGGSADGIVIDADKLLGAYDRRIVVFDCDKTKAEMNKARDEARARNISLLENKPCLESLLLAILNDGKVQNGMSSAWCKREFESKYIGKKKRSEPKEYENLFPKSLLDRQRKKVAELDNLISVIQG
jgi:hypothetical protein